MEFCTCSDGEQSQKLVRVCDARFFSRVPNATPDRLRLIQAYYGRVRKRELLDASEVPGFHQLTYGNNRRERAGPVALLL